VDKDKLKTVEDAIEAIARRDGVSVAHVRHRIRVAMRDGFGSADPKIRAFWDGIPREGAVPTPEEFVLFICELAEKRGAPE